MRGRDRPDSDGDFSLLSSSRVHGREGAPGPAAVTRGCYAACVPRTALGLLLSLGSLAACGPGDRLEGTLSVDSEEYGAWTMSPTTCVSGERRQFFGVDLTERGDNGSGVRIVDDPVDGYSLAMNIPDHDLALVVTAASKCEVFDVHLERGNVRVNNIWAVQGHAILECRADGMEIVADFQFSGCT
ncbi:hypothetical protein [Nannocystis bainbridge]|uniref:Lipoprotein n=1 Tax=Nannocystis bainbridge TaxID=2995303 RepID=A0ABT5E4I0_9BACT|nr:hypothetical protein [Nannocystis bainbridge]MDC0720769.1 hypothetical protein [Nannocystis bainbridge]